jgi:DNA-binding MltR family transcriptional regulator
MSSKFNTALRQLINQRSGGKVQEELIVMVTTDESPSHDRALAIVGAVFLEDALRGVLSKYLSPERLADAGAQIFEDENAPLQGLASRTRMAYALGLFDNRVHRDFTLIRNIRNAFAHSSGALTFRTDVIQTAVENLLITKDDDLTDIPISRRLLSSGSGSRWLFRSIAYFSIPTTSNGSRRKLDQSRLWKSR